MAEWYIVQRRQCSKDGIACKRCVRLYATCGTQSLLKVLWWNVFGHPGCLPDLVPSDYHLFGILKTSLGRQHFTTTAKSKNGCVHLPIWIGAYDEKICKLVLHYEKCLEWRGNYVEK